MKINDHIEKKVEEFSDKYASRVYRVNAGKIEDFTKAFQIFLRQALLSVAQESRDEALKEAEEAVVQPFAVSPMMSAEQAILGNEILRSVGRKLRSLRTKV